MATPRASRISCTIPLLIFLFALSPVEAQSQDGRPIAEAGLPRYAGQDPVVLDGTGSYDPNESGPLSYSWRQIYGPAVVISDANTATPTVSGFVQTDEIQECEFELVVSDGEMVSQPDTVKVVVVPTFTESRMVLENGSFDPNKPTIVYFGGASGSWDSGPVADFSKGGGSWSSSEWRSKANVVSFTQYFADPDANTLGWHRGATLTFSRCADAIIVYLSAVAPDYHQGIQTMGHSLGGVPAIDVALRLNKDYKDARYAVNRVSFFDAHADVLGASEYEARVADFIANPVDGEQCWLDSYPSAKGGRYSSALNIDFVNADFVTGLPVGISVNELHVLARNWYRKSLAREDTNAFNSGVVAGAYWSVVGPGKNLQLASTPSVETYRFICTWYGDELSGRMDLFDEPNHPGRLPEPVRLLDPIVAQGFGTIFTCEESENAVGYELLMGPDPHRVMDFRVISDTLAPPADFVEEILHEGMWWTIRARDQYGSTIYADPVRIEPEDRGNPDHPTLYAYWPLDETEGNTAYDQAGENHAFVYGNATWIPSGGKFGGALQFDGIDDWAFASLYQNLGERPFTIIAWIKGGTPNQAVISQPLVADWLMADAEGRLMTEIGGTGPSLRPLASGINITDGDWHQIALVLDGANRSLCVDGVTVAEDSQAGSGVPDASINIGVGKNYLPGTYWYGLIDDIRIDNRALTAEEIAALIQ